MSYPYGSSAQKDAYDYNTRPYEAPQPSRLDSYQTDTVEPYSAGNSRNRLNEDNGLRYRDEYQRNTDADWDASREKPAVANTPFGSQKESFAEWRKSHKEGGAWTRGSGLGCTCRFFFCSLLIFLFLLFSIVLTIVVYVRPPDVQFGSVDLDTDAPTGAIERTSTSITIHLKVPIIVENPNFFDAGISKITATAFYPISGQDVEVGGGNMTNVVFKSGQTTTINFPLSFEYSSEMDPTGAVLQDLMNRCGVNGGQRSDLPIKYTIKLDIKILIPTFSPSFSGSANFACPLDASDLSAIGGVLGNVKKRGDGFLDRALARLGL